MRREEQRIRRLGAALAALAAAVLAALAAAVLAAPAAAVLALMLAAAPDPAHAASKIRVVTTTSDLAALVREIGGEEVEVGAIAKGYQDPHFVDAKPSYLVKLRKADLFVQIGRDLEVGWAPALLRAARNATILPGGPGHLDASAGIEMLEVPTSVSRAEGDVHPLGNPHYWLDPANGVVVAATIRDALGRVAPERAARFHASYADFERRAGERIDAWRREAASLGLAGAKVVTYHRSWSYLAKALGLDVVDVVEPRPGVPPSPRHTKGLIETMKSQGVRLLLVEPYFDIRLPQQIARETGARLLILPPSVEATPEARDYLTLFDVQLRMLRDALRGGTAP